MLRTSILSLLLGALAVAAGMALFFAPPDVTQQSAPAIRLGADNAKLVLGEATFGNDGLQLLLNEAGVGIISFTNKNIATVAYPFLHLAIESDANDMYLALTWSTDEAIENHHTFVPQSKSWNSMWVDAREIRGWKGNASSLTLAMVGKPGTTVRIREVGLYTTSPLRQIQSVLSDLGSYVPWNRAAMNSHTGVTITSSFYPNILGAALLLLSLLAYSGLLLVFRAKSRFSWRTVAMIFLACWISLDMVWQRTLLHQVFDTYRTFAGKSSHEKLLAGPDSDLYAFVTQIIPLVKNRDARIFVSSSDTYLGQRGAYFLYPFNVFWPGPYGEFPADYLLRSGDLVLLINPTTMRFSVATNTLATSANSALDAELVFSDPMGTFVRVQ